MASDVALLTAMSVGGTGKLSMARLGGNASRVLGLLA